MINVTKARIIKDGRPVMTFSVNDTLDKDGMDAYRQEIKARYIAAMTADIQVDLQYKEIGR